MSFPETPLDIHVEMYINSAWVDVSADVLATTGDRGIAIARNGGIELTDATAGTLTLTLKNAEKYAAQNVSGPYYGFIGIYTPIRVYVLPHWTAVASADDVDTFTRSNTSAWGYTEGVVRLWGGYGSGVLSDGDWSTTGTTGNHRVNTAGNWRLSYVSGTQHTDCRVSIACRVAISNITGDDIELGGIYLRCNPATNKGYLARVHVSASEVLTARIYRDDSVLLAETTISGITWSGQWLSFKFEAIGSHLSYKVWETANSEPASDTVHTDDYTYTEANYVALRSGCGAGNTNVPVDFQWDNLYITNIQTRFHGTISSLPLLQISGGGAPFYTSQLTAGDALERCNQQRAVLTPLKERISAAGAMMYLPLDDGPRATGVSDVMTGMPGYTSGAGSIDYGKVAGPVGAPAPLPELARNTATGMPALTAVLADSSGASWTLDMMMRQTRSVSGTYALALPTVIVTDDSQITVQALWTTGGGTQQTMVGVSQINGPGGMSVISPSFDPFDGAWRHIRIAMDQAGSTATTTVYIDSVSIGSDSDTFTPGNVRYVSVLDNTKANVESASVGHIAVYHGTSVADTYTGALGNSGETVYERCSRLSTEANMPIVVFGDSTRELDVQRSAPLLDLLLDIRVTDIGVLRSSRTSPTIEYRELETLYNQQPCVVDYAGGHIYRLTQSDMTSRKWNSVTLERRDGGSATMIKSSGANNLSFPPLGIGVYDKGKLSVYPLTDNRLPNMASWYLAMGTADELCFTSVSVLLSRRAFLGDENTFSAVVSADTGNVLRIDNLPTSIVPDTVFARIISYTELLSQFVWNIDFTTVPGSIHAVAAYSDSQRYDSNASTLGTSINTTTTTISVAYTGNRWVRIADDGFAFPFNIMIGGELLTVTSVTGTTSPQTFAVTRSVNGVVKAHSDGTAIHIQNPVHYAL